MNPKDLEFRVLQLCSGHYLTEKILDNWRDLFEKEQNEFLEEKVWEPFEYYHINDVWNNITDARDRTLDFVNRLFV